MADTVVAPPEKTVVIETGKQGYGPAWSAEPTFGQTADAINVGNQTSHILNSLLTQFGFLGRETAFQGSEDREAMRHEGRASQKEMSDHRRETERDFGTLGTLMERGFGRTDTLLERGFGHTNEELAEGFGETRETIRVEACETREVVKDRAADIQLEAAKNAAAAALASATNTAAIQASLAACCCEIKERIASDGQSTRDLINATTLQGVRDALQDAKNETAIAKLLAGKVLG